MSTHRNSWKWLLFAGAIFVLIVAVAVSRKDETSTVTQHFPAKLESPYVGHSKCADCHSDIAEKHAGSGHSHTFALTKDVPLLSHLNGRVVTSDNGESYEYTVDQEGLATSLPGRFPGRLFPLDYALGSGKHAITFLTLLQESSGETVGVESHHTWFHDDNDLHVTPGQSDHHATSDVEFFGKVFRGKAMHDCVGCHTTTASVASHGITNLRPNVHCERCHGAGAKHVAAAENEDLDLARHCISRPATPHDEVSACGECHRMPEDIEVERLKRYPNSLVRFQPVGLLQSRCYTESNSLKCSTCHDPHAAPSETSRQDHIGACLSCHDSAPKRSVRFRRQTIVSGVICLALPWFVISHFTTTGSEYTTNCRDSKLHLFWNNLRWDSK